MLCPIMPPLPATHIDAPSACHAKIHRAIPMAENNRSNQISFLELRHVHAPKDQMHLQLDPALGRMEFLAIRIRA